MLDPFVWMAPVVLLVVVGLLQFVGCNILFHAEPPTPIVFEQVAEKSEILDTDQIVATFEAPVNAQTLMVVYIFYNSNAQTVLNVTDSAGTTYTRAIEPKVGEGRLSDWQQEIWIAPAVTGGPDLQVTAMFTGTFNATKGLAAHSYRNAAKSSPVRASAANTGKGLTAQTLEVHVEASDMVFGAALVRGTGSGPGVDFTPRSHLEDNVTDRVGVTEDQQVGDKSGARAATFILTADRDWIAQMLIIEADS